MIRRITIPAPPAVLAPNVKSHWATKHSATQDYGTIVAALARTHEQKPAQPIKWCVGLAVMVVPDRRRRDNDNFLACLKAAVDGLVAAEWFKDDSAAIIAGWLTAMRLDPTPHMYGPNQIEIAIADDLGGMSQVTYEFMATARSWAHGEKKRTKTMGNREESASGE